MCLTDMIVDYAPATWMTLERSRGESFLVIIPFALSIHAPLANVFPVMQTDIIISANDVNEQSDILACFRVDTDRSRLLPS